MNYTLYVITGLAVFFTVTIYPAQQFNSTEEQGSFELKHDKLGISRKAEMQTDTDRQLITTPPDCPDDTDFDVAQTPPVIDFGIIQGFHPWYLPLIKGASYSGWGDVTKGPDGCFYFAIGNHMSYGGNAYIVKYDPATKSQDIVVDLKKTVGYSDRDFGDGKFHGDPDIGPGGDMWLLSYFGPMPTKEELDTVYRGSWLIRHNIFSGETESLGIPLEGESWPYHGYDWDRGLLFGIGSIKNHVIAYDTKERRMLYGGAPSDTISWYERGVLVDRDTGVIYSTDSKMYPGTRLVGRYRGDQRYVKYERRNNAFTRMNAAPPPNPVTGSITAMRAHTKVRNDNGAYWCFDVSGAIFTFYPDEDRTESIGINWGIEGSYTANMCFSPGKRYIYYLPGADGSARRYGVPIVQYDTKTNRKKVIAFLRDFYLDKYSYKLDQTYGIELDEKGESLCFYISGRFTTKELNFGYRRPSIFLVHIPESERKE